MNTSSRRSSAFSARGHLAMTVARLATRASKTAGRGSGGMIGGVAALAIDTSIMDQLAQGRRVAVVTGTNGKSTTTRMLSSALATTHQLATNSNGDNMDAGIVSALIANRQAPVAVLEIDELHTPAASDRLTPEVFVLLNLSRDQLDRVGEINTIERRLREGLARHPQASVVANCDDVFMSSIAFDHPHVVWVGAGSSWHGDSVSCPRTGSAIVRHGGHWQASEKLPDGRRFERPQPHWWLDERTLYGPNGVAIPMKLALPGAANRGNAAQAVAAAATMGIDPQAAVTAVESVSDVAGRYSTIVSGEHEIRLLLAKNPAGWKEALSMIDVDVDGLVIAVNGQIPDGEDLSWLWDVEFEHFGTSSVVAAGERGTDLSVRLHYANVSHVLESDTLSAIRRCPPGRVDVLANYTAFRDLNAALTSGAH